MLAHIILAGILRIMTVSPALAIVSGIIFIASFSIW